MPDFAEVMDTLQCKACTASTSAHCGGLAAELETSGEHVKVSRPPLVEPHRLRGALKTPLLQAAYCNDDFLVIVADGLPKWDAGAALAGIELPPGGDTA